MISKERVRHMTKLSEFENEESKACQKATQYFRRDYVAMELIEKLLPEPLRSDFFCAMAFYDMENLVKKINDMDMIGFGIRIVMVYLVFLAAYLMITYIIYNRRYTKGRKR